LQLSDIQGYFSSQGQILNVPIVNVLLDGMNGSCGTSCDDSEAALHIEMALSLAPNLSAVVFYEGYTPLEILN
jgi:xanthomonalisin